jgi:alpha-N-arabinofuranosidase
VGSDYYLVTSSFEYFPGVPIFQSRDLVHWQKLGHCLTRPSQLPLHDAESSKGIFAPTLRYHAGLFYLVTTNMSHGGSFYVTATDPAGPWSEPIWLKEAAWTMDPSLFFDDDGKVYYTRHGGGERGEIFQAELDLASGQLKSEAKPIWAGTGGIWPEGPHLYRFSGQYYLLISEGGTGYGHALTVARSATPWGPFEACPHNPILSHAARTGHPIQATGHGDLVQTEDGQFWIVLLGIRPTDGQHHHLGREVFLAPVHWDAAGWPVIHGNAGIELEMPATGLPPVDAPNVSPTRDDFDSQRLAAVWNFVRNPIQDDYSLHDRPGFLRIFGGRASLDDVASPSFVCRRQQHFSCTVRTLLEFDTAAPGSEAGLCVRANEANHYDLVLTHAPAGRTLGLRARRQGVSETVAELAVEAGPIVLFIRARAECYEFFWSQPGAEPHSLGTLPTTPLSSEAAGGFTGVFFGLYARSAEHDRRAYADFDWFDYEAS